MAESRSCAEESLCSTVGESITCKFNAHVHVFTSASSPRIPGSAHFTLHGKTSQFFTSERGSLVYRDLPAPATSKARSRSLWGCLHVKETNQLAQFKLRPTQPGALKAMATNFSGPLPHTEKARTCCCLLLWLLHLAQLHHAQHLLRFRRRTLRAFTHQQRSPGHSTKSTVYETIPSRCGVRDVRAARVVLPSLVPVCHTTYQ
jgi:hypothetical protein